MPLFCKPTMVSSSSLEKKSDRSQLRMPEKIDDIVAISASACERWIQSDGAPDAAQAARCGLEGERIGATKRTGKRSSGEVQKSHEMKATLSIRSSETRK